MTGLDALMSRRKWYIEDEAPGQDDPQEKWEAWERSRVLRNPDVPIFMPPRMRKLFSLQGRSLQVIVKLANIELAPEKPKHEGGLRGIYGIRDEDPMNQEIGSIVAEEARLVAFPTIFQHRVAPFELVDCEKKGHRKILVFFLVDPKRKIVSTKNVAPQQREWVEDSSFKIGESFNIEEWTMTLEQAKKYREDLVSERKYMRDESNTEIYERPFSLCEH